MGELVVRVKYDKRHAHRRGLVERQRLCSKAHCTSCRGQQTAYCRQGQQHIEQEGEGFEHQVDDSCRGQGGGKQRSGGPRGAGLRIPAAWASGRLRNSKQ